MKIISGRRDGNEGAADGEETASDESQYVTFLIGREVYGIEVLKAQEIIGMTEITIVPNARPFVRGVINLRGTVVPVVDMRKKFQMDEREYDKSTAILITEVRDRPIGMIVDSVSDVVNIPDESIQSTPHFTLDVESDFVHGIAQLNEGLVIILDVDKILSEDELADIDIGDAV